MIGLMWTSEEPGYLVRNGKPLTKEKLFRTIHKFTQERFDVAFQTIEDESLFSVRKTDGAIYSRKILRDLETHEKWSEMGRRGAKATWVGKATGEAKAEAKATALAQAKEDAIAKAIAFIEAHEEPVGVPNGA